MRFGFENRRQAGRLLAAILSEYKDRDDVVVLALPRGGVPVGFEVATALGTQLDVFVVRKLGVPGHEEFAFGAIASGGELVVDARLVRALGLTRSTIDRVIEVETAELERRERVYRRTRTAEDLQGKTVIIVDDGLATGATMRVAVAALSRRGARKIVVAVPIASMDACEMLTGNTDAICVCSVTPDPFYGVGTWYRDFSQTSDEEVCDLLDKSRKVPSGRRAA
jgi:predicted phosphoribosyltransferase